MHSHNRRAAKQARNRAQRKLARRQRRVEAKRFSRHARGKGK